MKVQRVTGSNIAHSFSLCRTADSHATGTSTDSTEQKESKMDPSTLRRSNRKRKSSQRVPVSYTETSDEEKQSHKRKKYSCLFHFRGLK